MVHLSYNDRLRELEVVRLEKSQGNLINVQKYLKGGPEWEGGQRTRKTEPASP